MAYSVGSLADLISGTHDAGSSNVVFVPANKKIERSSKKVSSDVGNDGMAYDQLVPGSSDRKKRTYSPMSGGQEKPRLLGRNNPKKKVGERDEELESRTIFVKNVPYTADLKKIKHYFEHYGPIECVRFRCAPVKDIKIKKKVAVIKKDFHPDRTNICAFVRFKDRASSEEALKANGSLFEGHHIFVDRSLKEETHDQKRAIFLGNVPFGAEENDIWNIFSVCGTIKDIRIVRDSETGLGKGFAFVNFESADAVELAVSLQDVKLKEKTLRVFRASKKSITRQKNKANAVTRLSRKGKLKNGAERFKGYGNDNKRPNMKERVLSNKGFASKSKMEDRFDGSEHAGGKKKGNKNLHVQSTRPEKNFPIQQFQGQKMMDKKKKKKRKMNKEEYKKKIIAEKLASVGRKLVNAS